MYELTRYYDADHLLAAWLFEPKIEFRLSADGFAFRVDDPAWNRAHARLSEADRVTVLKELYGLGRMMRRGPVIARPGPGLCDALMDTEIRIPVRDYRQPYEFLGVELPPSIVGDVHPCLTMIWRPGPGHIFLWTFLRETGGTLYVNIGTDMETLEDRLGSMMNNGEEPLTEQDWRVLVQGSRVALNLGMLASRRPLDVEPLPAGVARHRRQSDDRLNRLAARHCQEVRFRDLVLEPRPRRDVMEGFGARRSKQRRRAHWRNVACGPRLAGRRWAWIDEYETRPGESWPDAPPTTVLS